MAIAWGTDYVGVEWWRADVIQELRVAIWERQIVLGTGVATPPDPIASGTNVQTAAFWSDLQAQVEALVPLFVRPGFQLHGHAAPAPFSNLDIDTAALRFANWKSLCQHLGKLGWTRKRPREIASLTAQFDQQGNRCVAGHRATCPAVPRGTTRFADYGLERMEAHTGQGIPVYEYNGTTWVAVEDHLDGPDILVSEAGAERTISSTSATTDIEGRPAVIGQLARGPLGKLYVYNGPTSTPPWAERTENESTGNVPDRLPTGSGVIAGRVQGVWTNPAPGSTFYQGMGDIIGPWIFAELCQFMQALGNRTLHGTGIVVLTGSNAVLTVSRSFDYTDYRFSVQGSDTPGEAHGKVADRWQPGSSWMTDTGPVPVDATGQAMAVGTQTIRGQNPAGTARYAMGANRVSDFKSRITTRSHRSRSVQFYAIAGNNTASARSTTDTVNKYDPHNSGLPPTPHVWGAWGAPLMLSSGTATSPFHPVSTSDATIPSSYVDADDFPTPIDPSNPNNVDLLSRGASMYNQQAILTWDFQYP